MNLNKYIKHHELYEFLRTKVDIPPIERTFFSSEYDHTLYRMAWMASNKQCEVTLGCHEQPFLLLISRIGEDMRRIHIPVLPEELAHFGLLERLENHTPSKLNVIQFYYVQSDYITQAALRLRTAKSGNSTSRLRMNFLRGRVNKYGNRKI